MFTLNVFAWDSRSPDVSKPPSPLQPPEDSINLFANKNTVDQIFSDKIFIEQFSLLKDSLDSQWGVISKDLRARAMKEFNRYNIGAVFGLEGNKVKLIGASLSEIEMNIGNLAITADLYYRIELKPSFKEGKQVRKDIYVLGLKGSSLITVGSEIKITFFREFDSKADALFSGKPYGLEQIPRNADDVINKLKVQDGVRVEVFGNLQLSDTITKFAKNENVSLTLGYDLFQGLFMFDIFKYSADEVRARYTGTVNRGTIRAGLELDWLYDPGVSGILRRIFKELAEFTFGFHVKKSFDLFNEYPIETHIADYFFRFDTGKTTDVTLTESCRFRSNSVEDQEVDPNQVLSTEAAFDEFIGNVRNGRFVSVFKPNLQEAAYSAALNGNAARAETIACLDRQLPSEKRRVLHFFKGRIGSDVFALDLGVNISRLLRSKLGEGNSEMFVSSIESDQAFNYYRLLNTFSKYENSYVFGRWEDKFASDLDSLFQCDKDKNIIQFLDFVKRIEYRDKVFSVSNLKEIYSDINRTIPGNFPDRQALLNLIPKKEERDGLISLVYSLSNQLVLNLEKLDRSTLYSTLYKFIDTHPERYLMGLPPPNTGEAGIVKSPFNDYITNVYYLIVKFSDSKLDPKERFYALKELMKKKVFTEYIFTELFPRLLTPNIANDAMSVKMSVSTASIAMNELKIGKNQSSTVYNAALLLRSILNDRTLDLRLESITVDDNPSNFNPVKIKGFTVAY